MQNAARSVLSSVYTAPAFRCAHGNRRRRPEGPPTATCSKTAAYDRMEKVAASPLPCKLWGMQARVCQRSVGVSRASLLAVNHQVIPLKHHGSSFPRPATPCQQPLSAPSQACCGPSPAASAHLSVAIATPLRLASQHSTLRVRCAMGSRQFAAATSSLQQVEPITDVTARYSTLLVDGDWLIIRIAGNLEPKIVAQRLMDYVRHVWAGFERVEVWVSGWRADKPDRGAGRISQRRKLCPIVQCFTALATAEPLAGLTNGCLVSAHVAFYGDADLGIAHQAAQLPNSIVAGGDSDFRLCNLSVITSMRWHDGVWMATVFEPFVVTKEWSLPSDVWDVLRAVEEHDYGRAILGAGSKRLARYLVRIKDTLPEGERLTVGKVYDRLSVSPGLPRQPRLAEPNAAELLVLGAVLRHGLPALAWSAILGRFTASLEAREAVLSVLGQGPWSGTDMVDQALERVVYVPDLTGLDEEQQQQHIQDMQRGARFYDGTNLTLPTSLHFWAKTSADTLATRMQSDAWLDTALAVLRGPCINCACSRTSQWYSAQPAMLQALEAKGKLVPDSGELVAACRSCWVSFEYTGKLRSLAGALKRCCAACATTTTSNWRRATPDVLIIIALHMEVDGPQQHLCNACFKYVDKHKCRRPHALLARPVKQYKNKLGLV